MTIIKIEKGIAVPIKQILKTDKIYKPLFQKYSNLGEISQ